MSPNAAAGDGIIVGQSNSLLQQARALTADIRENISCTPRESVSFLIVERRRQRENLRTIERDLQDVDVRIQDAMRHEALKAYMAPLFTGSPSHPEMKTPDPQLERFVEGLRASATAGLSDFLERAESLNELKQRRDGLTAARHIVKADLEGLQARDELELERLELDRVLVEMTWVSRGS